jgi:hypothetical protein
MPTLHLELKSKITGYFVRKQIVIENYKQTGRVYMEFLFIWCEKNHPQMLKNKDVS